jgi:hypothetical protein
VCISYVRVTALRDQFFERNRWTRAGDSGTIDSLHRLNRDMDEDFYLESHGVTMKQLLILITVGPIILIAGLMIVTVISSARA